MHWHMGWASGTADRMEESPAGNPKQTVAQWLPDSGLDIHPCIWACSKSSSREALSMERQSTDWIPFVLSTDWFRQNRSAFGAIGRLDPHDLDSLVSLSREISK